MIRRAKTDKPKAVKKKAPPKKRKSEEWDSDALSEGEIDYGGGTSEG